MVQDFIHQLYVQGLGSGLRVLHFNVIGVYGFGVMELGVNPKP